MVPLATDSVVPDNSTPSSSYCVCATGVTLSEHSKELSDIQNSIAQLYSCLNVEQHQLEREQQLQTKLEALKTELQPYEEVRVRVGAQNNTHMTSTESLNCRCIILFDCTIQIRTNFLTSALTVSCSQRLMFSTHSCNAFASLHSVGRHDYAVIA